MLENGQSEEKKWRIRIIRARVVTVLRITIITETIISAKKPASKAPYFIFPLFASFFKKSMIAPPYTSLFAWKWRSVNKRKIPVIEI